jgi:hypothetical protein
MRFQHDLHYVVGTRVIRQYRNKHVPELGAIHRVSPFKVLISYTTKRRGVRLAAWTIDGVLHTWAPTNN